MKVITAIGDDYINRKLNEIEEYEVIGKDILYQEGILEALEEIKDIELVILSNILPEEMNFKILINKIIMLKKDIEIIVFLKDKNQEIENYLNSKKIYKMYYLNDEGYKIFFESINSNYIESEKTISKEINELKNIIFEDIKEEKIENKEIKKCKNKEYKNKKNYIKKFKENCLKNIKNYNKLNNNFYSENNEKDNKIIVISGNFGAGKSVVSAMLSKHIASKNKKTLLIDFDLFNCSINTIFGTKKYDKKIDKTNIKNNIKIINKNLSVFCGLDFYFTEVNEIKTEVVKTILLELKNEYEFIIIDTSTYIKYKYVQTIIKTGDKIIFLLEPNLLEIKKGKQLLEIFIKDLEVDIDKIKIVFNKTNKYKIAQYVLEEIFSETEIIGNIEYEDKYNLMINKNMNFDINISEYENIYEKIIE